MIEYIVDGNYRRIGKEFEGTLERNWFYKDQLIPLAELDDTGAVVRKL